MNCPICTNVDAVTSNHPTRDACQVSCPSCGDFALSRSAAANCRNLDPDVRWKVSAWINEFGAKFIGSSEVEVAVASKVPSLHHRADRMLRWIVENFPTGELFSFDHNGLSRLDPQGRNSGVFLGFVQPNTNRLVSVGWNRTWDETMFMLAEVLCNELGLLVSQNNHAYQVSPKGLLYLEGRRESTSSICFCAMWFDAAVVSLWTDVIEPAIRTAGYEPLRIDGKQHNGKIDDEIVASIRASRFVVSDFTGSRGGVYYEAGFAHGLGLPVIFMCREGDDLHFDIRQYNCIFWNADNLEQARNRLLNRIVATIGRGPKALDTD